MQLPRGRFERFVRGATIRSSLTELVEKKFTGCCSGILGDNEGELIFEKGEIILAESLKSTGSDFLSELFSNQEGSVTVELSQYNDSQIKLAKEFNSKFSIKSEDFKSAYLTFCQDSHKKTETPVKTKKAEAKTGSASEGLKKEPSISAPADTDQKSDEDEPSDEEMILSLNEAEIESITKDFRTGAVDLLKRIHLDHLIKNEKTGGKKE